MLRTDTHDRDDSQVPVAEEVVMAQMLVMCQESLDPDRYVQFEAICRDLCETRKRSLRADSFDRALEASREYYQLRMSKSFLA